MIRRTAIVAPLAIFIFCFAFIATFAFAATTVTPNTTQLTIGDTLNVTVGGTTVIDVGGFTNALTSTTGACTLTQHGTYENGGNISTYTCTGADTLHGVTDTAGTQTYKVDGAYAFTITVNPLPVVTPPPPAPAPVIVSTQTDCTGTYRLQLTNMGNAALVNGTYTSSYCTPPTLAAVTLPVGATVTYRTVCNRFHRCYVGVGFVLRGLSIPVGGSVAVSFAVTP